MNIQQPDRHAHDGTGPAAHIASVARGNIYLSLETCNTYLRGLQSVALISREDKVLIMPLIPESGGGLLLKVRNARGDRVIHAQEFFREKGYVEDFQERAVAIHWSSEAAALVVSGIPKTAK